MDAISLAWAVEESRMCTWFTIVGGTYHFCNQSHKSVWSLPQSHCTCGLVLVGPFWLALMAIVRLAQEAWSLNWNGLKIAFIFYFLNYALLGFSNVGLGFLKNEINNEDEK